MFLRSRTRLPSRVITSSSGSPTFSRYSYLIPVLNFHPLVEPKDSHELIFDFHRLFCHPSIYPLSRMTDAPHLSHTPSTLDHAHMKWQDCHMVRNLATPKYAPLHITAHDHRSSPDTCI